MALTKKAFLTPKAALRQIQVPECDGFVFAQELRAKDLLELQEKYGRSKETSNLDFLYDLIYRAVVDEAGCKLFESPADVAEHCNLPVSSMKRLGEEIVTASGLTREPEKN